MAIQTIKNLFITDQKYSSSNDRFSYRSSNGIDRQARYLAEQYCSGFQLHDRRQHADAIDAFYAVDKHQFKHLSNDDALEAATAYVDALWAKDEIEKRYSNDGEIDQVAIADADYTTVQEPLSHRAEIIGMDQRYAEETTIAWHNHKTGDNYWTPFLEAQTIELRHALGDHDYPDKPRGGRSGYGTLACRYLVGVELHDLHTTEAWEEAIRMMTPYYQTILKAHRVE